MKSKSERLPKFRTLEPLPGPIVQTNPRLWVAKQNGLPCWYKPFDKDTIIHPFFTSRATEEAIRQGLDGGAFAVQPSQWTIVELRSRENPWHPSGRLDSLTLRRNDGWRDVTIVLKFHGEGEAIQCVSVFVEKQNAPSKPKFDAKYKGPRLAGDTNSAVVSEKRKRL